MFQNKIEIFQEMLNAAAQNSSVSQIYLNFTNKTIVFMEKTFKESTFKFSYGSNAKDSNNTSIKFEMVRKK